jgi:hypothetical protein
MEARLWAVTQRFEVATKVDQDLDDGIAKMRFEIELYERKRCEAETRTAELEMVLAAGFPAESLDLPSLEQEKDIGRYAKRTSGMLAKLRTCQTQIATVSEEMGNAGESFLEQLAVMAQRRSEAARPSVGSRR